MFSAMLTTRTRPPTIILASHAEEMLQPLLDVHICFDDRVQEYAQRAAVAEVVLGFPVVLVPVRCAG